MMDNFLSARFCKLKKVFAYLCFLVLISAGFVCPVRAQQVYPDLVAVSVTGPATAGPGQQITVTFTIQNQGPVDAGDFQVGLYLSPDATITTGDISLGVPLDVCGLHAGATLTVPVTLTVPSSVANGDYFLGVIADVSGNLIESDTTNNSIASNQKITISNLPNLVITSISAPATAYTGGGVIGTVTVINNGFTYAYHTGLYMYLSLTPEITSSSIYLGGGQSSPTILAGDSFTYNFNLGIDRTTPPASYYVVAKVDSSCSSATWHCGTTLVSSQKLELIGPALIMATISGPQTGYAGQSIMVNNTVQTKGMLYGDVVGPGEGWNQEAEIYVDFRLYEADRTTVHSYLSYRDAGFMGAGGTSTDNTAVTIPAGLAPGTYYVGARASAQVWDMNFPDYVNTVAESFLVSPDPITIINP
jgi:hypothetical protein